MSRCFAMAASALRIAAFSSSRSLIAVKVKVARNSNAASAAAAASAATWVRRRGAIRSHSAAKYAVGRRASPSTRSRRFASALMSGAPRVDGQRELLLAARDLGDGALADFVEAVDVLQLGRDLVDRGARIGRPLDERLLGSDVELADVQLDLVGRRHLARDLIEQIERGRLWRRRQLLAIAALEQDRNRVGILPRRAEQLRGRSL